MRRGGDSPSEATRPAADVEDVEACCDLRRGYQPRNPELEVVVGEACVEVLHREPIGAERDRVDHWERRTTLLIPASTATDPVEHVPPKNRVIDERVVEVVGRVVRHPEALHHTP